MSVSLKASRILVILSNELNAGARGLSRISNTPKDDSKHSTIPTRFFQNIKIPVLLILLKDLNSARVYNPVTPFKNFQIDQKYQKYRCFWNAPDIFRYFWKFWIPVREVFGDPDIFDYFFIFLIILIFSIFLNPPRVRKTPKDDSGPSKNTDPFSKISKIPVFSVIFERLEFCAGV